MKVGTISSGLNFGRPAPPGRGSAAGRKFWPYYNQRELCVYGGSAAGRNFSLLLTTAREQCLHLSDRFFFISFVFGLVSFGLIMTPLLIGGGLSDDTVRRLSVAYIGPKSRMERPRKTKIGTEVAHVIRESNTTFKVKRSPGRFAHRRVGALGGCSGSK